MVFWIGRKTTPHTSRLLRKAMTIFITFKYQKNRKKMETITAYISRYGLLCPVKVWSFTVKCVWSIHGADKTWTVYDLGKLKIV